METKEPANTGKKADTQCGVGPEKHRKGVIIKMSNEVGLDDIHNDLEISNRLMILSLVRQGVPQKDIAAAVGVSEGALSKMFSKGLLKRVAHLSKLSVQD